MKEMIANLLAKEVKLSKKEIENLIEIPPSEELGDYSFPCFILSEKYKKAPNKIAEELAEKLNLTKEIEKIEVKGPYLNFFANKKILGEKIIRKILSRKKKKGKKEKILIEHTSINPNASPHMGRIRNSIIGDSIKRILEYLGFETETHYYVNDISKQIAMMTLNCTGNEKFGQLLKKYQEIAYKVGKNKKLEKKVFEILNKFESGDRKTRQKFRKIVNTAVEGQKKIFSDFGIKFDYFDYESSYLNKQKEILSRLKKTKKLFTDKEGRKVLDQRGGNLDKSMKCAVLVLTRNDGTGLYPLRDIAYTLSKLKRAKRNIIVLGEDHKLYFRQLEAALKLLGEKAPEPVHYSFVLIQKKEAKSGKVKMSTRKGDVVLLEDFLKEAEQKAKKEIQKRKTKGDAKKVAVSAVKYAIIKNSPNRNIVFNLQEALNFEGDTGPYLQYSYARASSIIRKSKKKLNLKFKINDLRESEINLIKELGRFEEVVEKAGKDMNPSLIANFSFELCRIFNEFYHQSRVVGSEFEQFRLALVESFRIVVKKALYLLGIEVMEQM